jgi:hypothetical protein
MSRELVLCILAVVYDKIQTAQSNDVALWEYRSFLEKPFWEKRKIVPRKVTRLLPDRIQLSRRYQQDENGLRLTSVSG